MLLRVVHEIAVAPGICPENTDRNEGGQRSQGTEKNSTEFGIETATAA